MNPDNILEVLARIGALLEPTAREVWLLAVRQAMVLGTINTVVGAVLLGVALTCGVLAVRSYHQDPDDGFWYFGLFVLLVLGSFSIALLCQGLQDLCNPEWGAIIRLQSLVKQGG